MPAMNIHVAAAVAKLCILYRGLCTKDNRVHFPTHPLILLGTYRNWRIFFVAKRTPSRKALKIQRTSERIC